MLKARNKMLRTAERSVSSSGSAASFLPPTVQGVLKVQQQVKFCEKLHDTVEVIAEDHPHKANHPRDRKAAGADEKSTV